MGTIPLVSFTSSLQEKPTAPCLLGCDQPLPFPTLPYTSASPPGPQPWPRLSPTALMRVKMTQRFMASRGLPRSGPVGSNWKWSRSLVRVSLARTATEGNRSGQLWERSCLQTSLYRNRLREGNLGAASEMGDREKGVSQVKALLPVL